MAVLTRHRGRRVTPIAMCASGIAVARMSLSWPPRAHDRFAVLQVAMTELQRFWLRRRTPETTSPSPETGRAGFRPARLARLEAALFVSSGALAPRRLAHVASLPDAKEVGMLIEQLNDFYDRNGSAFRIERVATGYQLLTRPALAPWLDKIHQRQARLKLSAPLLETLAIVAYRQPVTRADVEAVRGVQCAEVLKQLMERGLIRITGEHDSLGRPYLYGTTRQFLDLYGLRNLDDLPLSDRLRRVLPEATPGTSEAAVADEDDVATPSAAAPNRSGTRPAAA